jgi:hypothetical protein
MEGASLQWNEIVIRSILGLIVIPAIAWYVAFMATRLVSIFRPWRTSHQSPMSSVTLTSRGARKRNPRKAVAAARFFEARTPLEIHRVAENYKEHAKSFERLKSWFTAFLAAPLVLLPALFLSVLHKIQEEPAIELLPIFVGLLAGTVIYASITWTAFRRFARQELHGVAYLLAVRCLGMCADLPRGRTSPLALDQQSATLGRILGTFSIVGYPGMSDRRRKDLQEHVRHVQQALHSASSGILKEGKSASKNLAEVVGVLVSRLAEQRWGCLLDEDQLVKGETALEHSIRAGNRKDAWIVIIGAVIAAGLVGAASALGVPAAATIPAALIFLVGPALVWGSKSMGIEPRFLLTSSKESLTGQGQRTDGQASTGGTSSPQ